jgi:hypothetical protein
MVSAVKSLLLFLFFLSFVVFVTIFLGAYAETRLQYTTFQQMYSKNMECRATIGGSGNLNSLQYSERVCGTIPTFETSIN